MRPGGGLGVAGEVHPRQRAQQAGDVLQVMPEFRPALGVLQTLDYLGDRRDVIRGLADSQVARLLSRLVKVRAERCA